MDKKLFSNIQKIDLSTKKNLYIRSWDKDDIEIRYKKGYLLDETLDGSSLSIISKSNLLVSLPVTVEVRVVKTDGNCVFSGKFGHVLAEKIGGNFELEAAKSLSVESVGGNCLIGKTDEKLKLENVAGNVKVQSNGESIELGNIGGNLTAVGEKMNLHARSGGNIKLKSNRFVGETNELSAGGNVKIALTQSPDLTLHAKCGGLLKIDIAGEIEKGLSRSFKKVYGEGTTNLEVKAGGNIRISDAEDFEIDDPKFRQYDDTRWDELDRDIETRGDLSSGFDFTSIMEMDRDISSQINDKVREMEDKFRYDEEKMQRAQEKIHKAMDKMNQKIGFTGFSEGTQTVKSVSKPSISEEERMMVLKMLQEKKITAEEADRLLKALEE